jgi:hypothetical protein
VAPSVWQLVDTSTKRSARPGPLDWFVVSFFSVLTMGILPMIFATAARARRRLLRSFIRDGVPGVAEIMAIQPTKADFGQQMARVSYQFEADGLLRRDADQVLPWIADRWGPGDRVQILYRPDQDYDSVIVSTS